MMQTVKSSETKPVGLFCLQRVFNFVVLSEVAKLITVYCLVRVHAWETLSLHVNDQ